MKPSKPPGCGSSSLASGGEPRVRFVRVEEPLELRDAPIADRGKRAGLPLCLGTATRTHHVEAHATRHAISLGGHVTCLPPMDAGLTRVLGDRGKPIKAVARAAFDRIGRIHVLELRIDPIGYPRNDLINVLPARDTVVDSREEPFDQPDRRFGDRSALLD